MNTISNTQKLASLLADFERQSGQTIPTVTPLADLYRYYCDWSRRNRLPAQSIAAFLLGLVHKTDCVPCRLPDGAVGVIGFAPKAMMATGVMQ